MRSFFKNVSYVFFVNILSVIISIFMVAFLPKMISVEDYGLWQLYLFYMTYVGFFHFGWEDGIYLRYAGIEYGKLDKKILNGQIWGIILLEITIAIGLLLLINIFVVDEEKKIIYYAISISLVLANFNNLANIIFQITNRISDYAVRVAVEKISCPMMIILFCIIGINYRLLLLAQVLSLVIVSLFSIYTLKEVLFYRFSLNKNFHREMKANLSAGFKLMIANSAGMLVIGIIRYGISETWSISVFGQVSLGLSIMNFYMLAINSASVVLFPMLKRANKIDLYKGYIYGREFLLILTMFFLLLYYPAIIILKWWIPQYGDAIFYLLFLFPICIFESRIVLLLNTYFKALRMESDLLKVNVYTVILSICFSVVGCVYLKSLSIVIISILLVEMFKCFYEEYILSKRYDLTLSNKIITEIMLIIIFIISNRLFSFCHACIINICYILIIIFLKKHYLISGIRWMKDIVTGNN